MIDITGNFEEEERFSIIYADPPWDYKDKARAGKRGAAYQYNTVAVEKLADIPVKNIAAKNCVLFMWVTPPTIEQAFKLAKAWGFKYKTKAFVWIKVNKGGTYFKGMGHYVRANSEDCYIFTKGKSLPRQSKSVQQVIVEPRREHSRKPDAARDRIVELYGNDLRKIELFARTQADGWEAWGNQINKFKE